MVKGENRSHVGTITHCRQNSAGERYRALISVGKITTGTYIFLSLLRCMPYKTGLERKYYIKQHVWEKVKYVGILDAPFLIWNRKSSKINMAAMWL